MGLLLDKRLSFNEYIPSKMNKYYKMIGVLKSLSVNLPCDELLTVYKSFIRPHVYYAGIVYDRPHKESFKTKLKIFNIKLALQ